MLTFIGSILYNSPFLAHHTIININVYNVSKSSFTGSLLSQLFDNEYKIIPINPSSHLTIFQKVHYQGTHMTGPHGESLEILNSW